MSCKFVQIRLFSAAAHMQKEGILLISSRYHYILTLFQGFLCHSPPVTAQDKDLSLMPGADGSADNAVLPCQGRLILPFLPGLA